MEKRSKQGIALALFIVALGLFLFSWYFGNSILEKKSIPVSFNVSKKAGIDLNGSALTFGNVIPGTSSQRDLVIKNDYEFPIILELEARGEIKNFLKFEKKHEIPAGESKEISVVARIPKGEESKSYSGDFFAILKKK